MNISVRSRLLNFVLSFAINRICSDPPETFEEQFALFSTHGIMISPHSAGLTNTVFLPPGSAVIELFPYHMHHTLYTGIAFNTGVASFPVHAVNGSIIWRRDPVRSIGHPALGQCALNRCVCHPPRPLYSPRLYSKRTLVASVEVAAALWLCCVLRRKRISGALSVGLFHAPYGGLHTFPSLVSR